MCTMCTPQPKVLQQYLYNFTSLLISFSSYVHYTRIYVQYLCIQYIEVIRKVIQSPMEELAGRTLQLKTQLFVIEVSRCDNILACVGWFWLMAWVSTRLVVKGIP